ncbi:hypothetical protein IV73_GL001069 [Weissella kandleri]|uniref:Uncharacterized protein n=1 Tax=Weissella kandleri TaxID=1616 RepID=A0A0R2JBW4_9LACO|nr:hypothetical protein [Weissella kandleri]KRN74792.1 hypothetical protein IV73_GL001069 [Weissella kandleri]
MELKNKKLLYLLSGIGVLIIILLLVIVMQNNNNNPDVQAAKSSSVEHQSSISSASSESLEESKLMKKASSFSKYKGPVLYVGDGVAYKTSWTKDQYEQFVKEHKDNIGTMLGSKAKVNFASDLGTSQNFDTYDKLSFVDSSDEAYFDSAKDAYLYTVKHMHDDVANSLVLKEIK